MRLLAYGRVYTTRLSAPVPLACDDKTQPPSGQLYAGRAEPVRVGLWIPVRRVWLDAVVRLARPPECARPVRSLARLGCRTHRIRRGTSYRFRIVHSRSGVHRFRPHGGRLLLDASAAFAVADR